MQGALAHLDGRAAREAARKAKRGDRLFPALTVEGDTWMLQLSPDSEPRPITTAEAYHLNGIEKAA